jgi:molybdopterin synthase catalytic subunit
MIEVTKSPISPELAISTVKNTESGCVLAYVGLIRNLSRGKPVLSVEYEDIGGGAKDSLAEIATDIKQRWPVNDVSIYHRVGRLEVGEVNLVVAVSSAHRRDAFAACQYAVDRFKQKLPTRKKETYQDGSVWADGNGE